MTTEKAHVDHLEKFSPNDGTTDAAVVDLDSLDTIELTKTGKFPWLVSITAAMGGMLFGYDTGIISAVLVYIQQDLGHTLSSSEKELITSITSGGAFVGAIFAGLTADRYGRKIAIYVGCFLFTAGAILQAAAYNLALMTAGRLVVGFGVGSAAMIVPMYIAEVAQAKLRGRMIGLDNMSITGGQLVSYGIGAAFAHVDGGWRYMVGGGAIPALLFAALLPLCPESPRQLVYHSRSEQAAAVLRRIFPTATEDQVQDKVRHITLDVEGAKNLNSGKSQWWIFKQLYVVPGNFRALLSACGLMAIFQLGGFNALMYYSPTLFALVGFADPVAVGTVIAGTNFLFTFVNLLLVDRVGRRRILLCTVPFMGLALLIAAICFVWIPIHHDLALAENAKIGWPAIVVLVGMVIYVGFFSSGIGNTAWLSNELFPLEIRAMGTMMLTMTCWGSNIIVASTFLTPMEDTTPSGTFGFYAVKGMTLENIREIYQHGFGVRRAREIQKEMKEARKIREEMGPRV